MRKEYNGYITLYLALTIGVLISLVFTMMEGVRMQTIRLETEGVMDIGLHSVFGEYNRQLLEQYDLFYIDTTYGEGKPSVEKLQEHLQYYMNRNFVKKEIESWLGYRDLTALYCDNIVLEGYERPSDCEGQILKKQIVEYMKDKEGIALLETAAEYANLIQANGFDSRDVEGEWSQVQGEIQHLLEQKKQELLQSGEEETEVEVGIDNPADYVAGVKGRGILSLALPSGVTLSGVEIHPEYYLSHRTVLNGLGSTYQHNSVIQGTAEKLLVQNYLFEKCGSFQKPLDKGVLKYQIEYLLKGKSKDEENLRQVVEDILHIREAANIAYLLSDNEKQSEADLLATVITAVLFMPQLQQAVKLSILFAWAYAESIKDIRILLDGNKVPMIKNSDSWNTPLIQLLTFVSHLGDYKKSESGMSYEDYLNTFLFMKSEKEVLYRFMDICEMDIRITEGNSYFQMDGCISTATARANVSSSYGYGYEIIRSFSYLQQ